MASEYRQLGTPRFQPVQQIGGGGFTAPRDLGTEQMLKGFANLSQSLTQAGQQLGQEEIKKAVEEGKAWRQQSQKTFREAVSAGEIHPTQNPHFAIGAMAVDGEMNARSAMTQFMSEWQQETADPNSSLARQQGGFETFMQDRLAAYVEENPFSSQYQSTPFYEIALGTIDRNSVKQNEAALERDLYYTNEAHVANILDLAVSDYEPMTVMDPIASIAQLGQRAGRALVAQSVQTPQMAYDSLYESGALTPSLKTLLLERTYVAALNQQEVSPEVFVDRVRNLKQGSSTLGETKEGQEINASALGSKVREATNRWKSSKREELKGKFSSHLGLHQYHTKALSNAKKRVEQIVADGQDPTPFVQKFVSDYANVGPVVFKVLGAEEFQKWTYNYEEVQLELLDILGEQTKIYNYVANASDLSASGWYDAATVLGGTTKRDDLFNRRILTLPPEQQINTYATILMHSSFPPLDRRLADAASDIKAVRDGNLSADKIPSTLVARFGLYAQLRNAKVSSKNILNEATYVGRFFESAYSKLTDPSDQQSYETALSEAAAAMTVEDSIVLGNAVTPSAGAGAGRRMTADNETELQNVVENFDNYPPTVRQSIYNSVDGQAATSLGMSRSTAFEVAAPDVVEENYILGKNFVADRKQSGALIADPALQERFLSEWLPGDFTNAVNSPELGLLRQQANTKAADTYLRQTLKVGYISPKAREVALARQAAWEIFGGTGTVPADGTPFDNFMERLTGAVTAPGRAMLSAISPSFRETEARAAQDRTKLVEALYGILAEPRDLTLDTLFEAAPEELLTWFRRQTWYSEELERESLLGGYVDPDNMFIQLLPSGGMVAYTRTDDESEYEPYAGGASGPTQYISAETVEKSRDGFLKYLREDGPKTIIRSIPDEERRKGPEISQTVKNIDGLLDRTAIRVARTFGLTLDTLRPLEALETTLSNAGEIILDGSSGLLQSVIPGDDERRRPHYAFDKLGDARR